MGNEREDIVGLDLNLEPLAPLSPGPGFGSGTLSSELENIDDRIGERIRRLEAVRLRARHRWRWRQGLIPPETRNISMELVLNSSGEERLQTGEGSVAAEERLQTGNCKACNKNATDLIAKALGEEKEVEKGNNDSQSFFDCNVCLDIAREPVLTCCGHLFCWSCLYQWLHVHSDTKECPVCKGEVTDTGITPIYGRGSDNREHEREDELGLKIPPRPPAQRVESLRQSIHRAASSFPIEEMIRRIGNRFDMTAEWVPPTQDLGTAHDMPERTNSLTNRIFTSRGIRREGVGRRLVLGQNLGIPPEEIVDLTQGIASSSEAEGSRRLPSLLLRRSQTQRNPSLSPMSSVMNSAERIVDAYFHNRPVRRNHSQSPPMEDRDSVSSIAAVIQSESQTVDTAMEIDSMVSLSSSSSRRRTDASRVSDVDSVASRSTRRRRLN